MENDIGIWFLLLSLFLPRVVLFFWWLTGNLPFNTTPLVADVLCAVLLPRILILVYIHGLQGLSPWFWIHIVAMFIAWGWNLLNHEKNMERIEKVWNRS